MHSLALRTSKLFYVLLYCLFGLSLGCYLTGLMMVRFSKIHAEFKLLDNCDFVKFSSSKSDVVFDKLKCKFDLKVENLQSYNNWNLKQLFFYIQLTWVDDEKK